MVVFSPVVLLLCTLWEPCARFFNKYSAFTDQKKKKKKNIIGGYGTELWKDIRKEWLTFSQNTTFSLGNERRLGFWKDSW